MSTKFIPTLHLKNGEIKPVNQPAVSDCTEEGD